MGATQHQKLYNKQRWKRLRAWHRQREPLCRTCKARGLVVPAQVVDHIMQHNGDERLFFDPENLQSLCKPCHDKLKAGDERAGRTWSREVGPDGWPLDPKHPANLPRAWQLKARQP
jgi:5-methylcytosine-specific restriction protein A